MARLLLLLIVAAGLYFLIRWITRQPARVRWQTAAVALAAVLLVLVLTGRAHWLAALFAAVLPFLRGLLSLAGNWPLIRRLLGGLGACLVPQPQEPPAAVEPAPESGVVERLSNAAQNEIINIVTIFLGLSVGSRLSADKFLSVETLGILALGAVAL